jgi:hypothetical protein
MTLMTPTFQAIPTHLPIHLVYKLLVAITMENSPPLSIPAAWPTPLRSNTLLTPFPPSYIRGSKRIDFILVSQGISLAVLRSGNLSYYSLFQGDHLPYFLDFDANLYCLLTQHMTSPLLFMHQKLHLQFHPLSTNTEMSCMTNYLTTKYLKNYNP